MVVLLNNPSPKNNSRSAEWNSLDREFPLPHLPHHSFVRSSSEYARRHVSPVSKEGQEELRGREGGSVAAAAGTADEQEQEHGVFKRPEIRVLNPRPRHLRMWLCWHAGTL